MLSVPMTNPLEKLLSTIDEHATIARIESTISEAIGPMGRKHWPGRRVHKLPRGYSDQITITDESIDNAFSETRTVEALVLVAGAYTSAVYAPMTRAALISGDDSEEECPATLRSYK